MQPCQCWHVAALGRHKKQRLLTSLPMRLLYDSAVVAAAVPLMHRLRSSQPQHVSAQRTAVRNRLFLKARCTSRRLRPSFRNPLVPTGPAREECHGSLHAASCGGCGDGNCRLVSRLLRVTAKSREVQPCLLSASADLTWRTPTVGPAFGEQKFEALSVGVPCYVAWRVRMLAVREVSSFLLAHAFGWMPCSNSSTSPQLCLVRVCRGPVHG